MRAMVRLPGLLAAINGLLTPRRPTCWRPTNGTCIGAGNKPAFKIPWLPHKPATGGPNCRLNAKRPYACRYSLSGDSIKANTRRGVFRVNPVGRRAFPGHDETRPYPGHPGPSLGRMT